MPAARIATAEPLPAAPPRLASVVLSHYTIGASPGQVRLADATRGGLVGTKTRLEGEAQILPELDAQLAPRPLRRQPAFLVAMSLALVAIVVCGGLVIRQMVLREPERVENVTLRDIGDNYLLEWEGPDVPYSLTLTTADGDDPGDVSDMIRSRQAWIPKGADRVTRDSCLVIGPKTDSWSFTVDAQELQAQGGAMVCVADAEDS